MIRYRGVVTLWPDALPRGPRPNPTRSFILGVPTNGGIGAGCIITVLGRADISGGMHSEALIDVVTSEFAECLPPTMPIWYGKIIGEVSELVRLDPDENPPLNEAE